MRRTVLLCVLLVVLVLVGVVVYLLRPEPTDSSVAMNSAPLDQPSATKPKPEPKQNTPQPQPDTPAKPDKTPEPKPEEKVTPKPDPGMEADPTDMPEELPRGQLIVSLPPHPGGNPDASYILCARPKAGRVERDGVELGTRREDHTFSRNDSPMVIAESGLEPGAWEIYLMGRGNTGYLPAPAHEPVLVQIVSHETSRVTLPEIPPAPWAFTAARLRVEFTCGGEEAYVNTPMIFGEEGVDRSEDDWLPTAIPDGDDVVQANVTEPADENSDAYARFDLETRIEVTITSGGKPATGSYGLEIWAETAHGPYRMRDAVSGGPKSMWAPQGQAKLQITTGSRGHTTVEFEQILQIRAGGVLKVNAELGLVEVTLTGGWRDIKDVWIWHPNAPDWGIVRMDGEEHEVITTLAFGREHEEKLTLKPGLYRAIPLLSDVGNTVDFDLGDGMARTVDLPKLSPASMGQVELTLDVEIPAEASISADLYWQPASEAREMHEHNYAPNHTVESAGNGKLTVKEVPVGCDVYLFGTIRVMPRQGHGSLYILKPIRIKADASGQSLVATCLPAKMLAGNVGRLEFGNVSLVPGHCFPMHMLQVPVGTTEIVVRRPDGTQALREKLEIAAADQRIPDWFQEKLDAVVVASREE